MPHHQTVQYLFGGDRPWDPSAWDATDDRVRGGASVSHLTPVGPNDGDDDALAVRFHGTLDTKTLGGAGFASQQTRGGEQRHWDLSSFGGLLIRLGAGPGAADDGRRYVVTLKDEIPGRRDDGRARSGVSWEADFVADGRQDRVWLPWGSFRATYRGKPKDDAKPLDLSNIKRIGLMMRSFFDQQHGHFDLEVRSIAAASAPEPCDDDDDSSDSDSVRKEKAAQHPERHSERHSAGSPWWRGVFCGLL